MLSVILWEWLNFAVRWLHVIAGIAWIGSSFYFIALDLGLRRHERLPEGVQGEEWQVHGGGFYHVQKYMVAPNHMPEDLVWFKWESYTTWLSGFALLCVLYYASADLYLIDRNVLDISAHTAIIFSLASLSLGFLGYDALCRSKLGENDTALMVVLFILIVFLSWLFTQVFSGRAAMLHVGALTATIMSGNVFFVIIPNQRVVVADLKAGRTPEAKYGKQAKQRSVHNNYLTLPVLFLMLSNHYPLAFASPYNWVIAALIFLMGVVIRHYFNTIHARAGNPRWTWAVAAGLFVAIVALSAIPARAPAQEAAAPRSAQAQRLALSPHFPEVVDIVEGYCSSCHARDVTWPGLATAPKGVRLDGEAEILVRAREIYLQAGLTSAMPPPHIGRLPREDRQIIVTWFETQDQIRLRRSGW